MTPHKFLRRKAASIYLHETYGLDRAPSTLAKLAVIGGGPPFRRINRIPLYATGDLDLWVESKLTAPMRSTSEPASQNYDTPDTCRQADPGADVKQGNSDNAEKSTARRQRAIT
jgi:hypothetical protein